MRRSTAVAPRAADATAPGRQRGVRGAEDGNRHSGGTQVGELYILPSLIRAAIQLERQVAECHLPAVGRRGFATVCRRHALSL